MKKHSQVSAANYLFHAFTLVAIAAIFSSASFSVFAEMYKVSANSSPSTTNNSMSVSHEQQADKVPDAGQNETESNLQLEAIAEANTQAEVVPLWAADINLIAFVFDAYPGSSFQHKIIAPVPNFRLNSPFLQSSGGGVNARVFNSEKLDLGLTFSGTLPTKNSDLEVREERNMRDLDPSFEVGMSLKYVPYKSKKWRLQTQLPLRKATGLKVQDQNELWRIQKPIDLGWTLTPKITLTRFVKAENALYEFDVQVGSKYATQQNMNFFYGVEQEFADEVGEQAFVAEAGLVNHWANVGVTRKTEKWRFSVFAEYSDLHDAENLASPLIEVKDSWSGVMVLTYTYAQSGLMIEQDSEFKN